MTPGLLEALEERHSCVSYFLFGVSRIQFIGTRGTRKRKIEDVLFNARVANLFLCTGLPRGRSSRLESLMSPDRRFANFEKWSFICNERTRYLIFENHRGEVPNLQTHVRDKVFFCDSIELRKHDVRNGFSVDKLAVTKRKTRARLARWIDEGCPGRPIRVNSHFRREEDGAIRKAKNAITAAGVCTGILNSSCLITSTVGDTEFFHE